MSWSTRARVALAGVVALAAGWVTPAGAQELTLSVAISMKEAIETVGRSFAQSRPGLTLRYNFGASGDLQKQIEAGAPIDVFVSAATRQMDELERKGLILPDTRHAFARNVLVVVKPADSALDLTAVGDLLDARVTRVAIGNPRTVPAGQYAQESLRAVGVWERLGPKLVYGENVRQVLEYVARGEVDAGFVYATDVAAAGPSGPDRVPAGGGHVSPGRVPGGRGGRLAPGRPGAGLRRARDRGRGPGGPPAARIPAARPGRPVSAGSRRARA